MKNDLLFTSDFVCFTTREYALANNQSVSSASHTLHRLQTHKTIVQVTKGIWANTKHPYFSPYGCVPLLLGREQGYISFLTALHRHGAISQIPATIQIATTAHARKLVTSIGVFEFFHLKPQMMMEGVDWTDAKVPYRMASAEKALLDTLYISARKGRRFSSLPEVDFNFGKKAFHLLLKKQVEDKNLTTAITDRFEKVRHCISN